MRFLVDECTGPFVGKWLTEEGHEVFSVYDESRGATDDELLVKAYAEDYLLITNDKDFGEKIYRDRRPHKGVIFMRLNDERSGNKIAVLRQLLANYADQLPSRFVVVTEHHVRFAKPPNL